MKLLILSTWSYLTGFDTENFHNRISEKKGFSLNYELPDSKKIFESDDVKIAINAKINIPSVFPPPSQIVFKERNYFTILNKKFQKGFFFIEYIDAVRKFLSLSIRENIEVLSIRTIRQDSNEKLDFLYNLIPIDLDYRAKEFSPYYMFFTYPEVDSKINTLFKCWLDGYLEMTEVYNLYFYKSKGKTYNVLLTKAQALEEFHRNYKEQSNHWGFKSRISYLFEKFNQAMKYTGNKEIFSQLLLDHRDYFSHWFQKKRNKVFNDVKLDYLARDANLLLEMCFLLQMGFQRTNIYKMVENNSYYRAYLDIGRPEGEKVKPPPRIKWETSILPI